MKNCRQVNSFVAFCYQNNGTLTLIPMTMIMSIMTVMTCKAVIRNLFRVGGGVLPSLPFLSFFPVLLPFFAVLSLFPPQVAPQIQLTDLGNTVSSPVGDSNIYSHQTRLVGSP